MTSSHVRAGLGPKALSLFSGMGGFCEGMKLAGFHVPVALELDKYACATYRYNFPETHLIEGDIAAFTSQSPEALADKYDLKDLDVVFGGPPCQGYSQIGTRDLNDPRNQLYRQFTSVLRMFRPAVFVMENVPNMLLLKGGMFRDAALREFADAGYSPAGLVLLDASEYGVPQQRRRVFYFGVRKDLGFTGSVEEIVQTALSRLKVAQPVSVWDAIRDLPKTVTDSGMQLPYPACRNPSAFIAEMRLDMSGKVYSKSTKALRGIQHLDNPILMNHHTKEIQKRRLALIKRLKPGLKADSLPKSMWDGARPEKWRRLHPDQPAYTILAQMHRDMSEFVHPKLDRWITVREALRLQSFHDGFVPVTSEWQQLKQIGNAVPPLLARAVGFAARELLATAAITEHRLSP